MTAVAEVRDVIEREVVIAAPRARVWRALTDAEQLAAWFSRDGCEVDLRLGGMIVFHWGEMADPAVIVALDEPARFAWSWVPGDLLRADIPWEQQAKTTVELTLEETADGHTRVVGRETGFAALSPEDRERALRMNTEGWGDFYAMLAAHLAS